MDVAILAAARFRIDEPFAGGMEAHTDTLATELVRLGHEVTVYAAAGRGPYAVRPMLPVDFAASPQARRDVSAGDASSLAEHHSYLEAILALSRSSHEVVHINAVHHLPFACAPLLASSVVTATLHTPPTPWLESALAIAGRSNGRPAMVSVSETNARAWGDLPMCGVIHNGIDLDRWRQGPGGSGATWWGRIVPEKAPHLAIEAARLAGVPLTLLGPIHDVAYFEDRIAPQLGDGVRYGGHGDVAAVAAAVGRSAVALVTPAWDEPFGLIVAEAAACGTPVAGFARGALPELVTEETGILVAPDDVEGLAAAMLAAATLDRDTCRRHAEANFSAAVMGGRYERWFEQLLAARS